MKTLLLIGIGLSALSSLFALTVAPGTHPHDYSGGAWLPYVVGALIGVLSMTHGTIAGILLTDLIVGRQNPWTALYDPSRKTLRAAERFVKESLNVALQYSAWLTGGDVGTTQEIAPGQGAVVRRGLTKVAAYRDELGVLHECSAVCPHLGCIVEWNHDESTWDCPCHGSRFDKQGHLVCGPANCDLAAIHTE